MDAGNRRHVCNSSERSNSKDAATAVTHQQ
jgi:hypothetical protein